MIAEVIVVILLLFGAFFTIVGSFGLLRLDDFYKRLHGPTKATTLGVGSLLIASIVYFYAQDGTVTLHNLLVAAFLFLTAPVSAHLMTRAGIGLRTPGNTVTPPEADTLLRDAPQELQDAHPH